MRMRIVRRKVTVVLPVVRSGLWVVIKEWGLTHGRGCMRRVFHYEVGGDSATQQLVCWQQW